MKADGLLSRNWLKGEAGDALHAVMCGAGYNLLLILPRLRALFLALIAVLAELAHSVAHASQVENGHRGRLAV
jgi:IS5 family transposase